MDQPPQPEQRTGALNTQIIVALIGASATVVAALLAGYFGLVNRNQQPPTSPATAIPTTGPSVTIDGPTTAPLSELTYFNIISSNATRAEWSIGGFNDNKTTEVDPLAPSHQIQIEPTDQSRVGDSFTLVVTVFDENGATANTTHSFQVTDDE